MYRNTSPCCLVNLNNNYIIPPIPPIPGAPIGIAGPSSLISAKTHSVVNNMAAIDAAFSNAIRDTLVGSITPAAKRFSNLSVRALYPKSAFPSRTF
jgi:hypothetical protein